MFKSLRQISRLTIFLITVTGVGHGQALPTPVPGPPILKAQVRLVILDVSVLDQHGNPVPGLKREDFLVKEDNRPQTLSGFDNHVAIASAGSQVSVPSSPDGTTTVSNRPINSAIVWNVILVDQLNTPMEDQARTLKQLRQFIGQMPAGQPLALITMGGQIKVLVPFQDGAGAIAQLLDKKGLIPANSSPPADLGIGASDRAEALQNKARIDVEQQAHRAQTTLDCFSAISNWLNKYPGRKNVYWLTAGFPLEGQPFGALGYDQMHPTGPANHGSQTMPLQQVVDTQLQSARVAIYPIDARGVARPDIEGETTADTEGNFLKIGNLGDKSINVKREDQLKAAQQSEMLSVAQATGGSAHFNNDIAQTLRDDFNQAQSYYTLSYTPSNSDWNGAYRRIDLRLQPKGLQLVYRRGYYASDPQPQPIPTRQQFRLALVHGATPETSVLFTANLSTSGDAATVDYAIDPRTVQFQPNSSGKEVANLDCAIIEYDSAAKVIGTSLINVASTVDAGSSSASLSAKQTIPLTPGAASLSLGVRDQSTGLFGTLEVALPPAHK